MSSLMPQSETRFVLPPPELQRYITTYYFTDIESADGKPLSDLMLPQWASVRFFLRGSIQAKIEGSEYDESPRAGMAGPTSLATPILATSAHIASFGLLPLGWYKLVRRPASQWANKLVDVEKVSEFHFFAALWEKIRSVRSETDIVEIFNNSLLEALPAPDAKDEKIEKAHTALTDPEVSSVAVLCERLDMNSTQIKRFSNRVFGFPPKLLLRRQRFVRTLGQAMTDPGQNWSHYLDLNYYDQSHFNRDFKTFMGMTPQEYMTEPHPIFGAAAINRTKALGQPLQALQRPGSKDDSEGD